MINYRSGTLFRNLVTGLLSVYLFYALANIYFIPNCVSGNAKVSLFAHMGFRRQRVQADQSSVGVILVGERSILDDDLLGSIKWLPAVVLLFFVFAFIRAERKRCYSRLTVLPQRRYDYLSFCRLRI